MPNLISILLVVALLYPLVMLILYWIQEWFLFHPEVLPQDFQFDYSIPFEEYFFEPEEGVSINALHFTTPSPKGIVFYLKGNSRSIKGWAKFARDFTSKGYDLMIFDYRGFGKSKGVRNEEGMYRDAQYIYDWVKERYAESHIVVYGRSMGSGFAAKIAADNAPQMLILDAPYYSLLHLAYRYLPILPLKWILRYHIRTDAFMEKVECPVYVFHGTRDMTIPFQSGVALARMAGRNGTLISIRGGGHNNLRNFPKYHEYLYYILGLIPQQTQAAQAA